MTYIMCKYTDFKNAIKREWNLNSVEFILIIVKSNEYIQQKPKKQSKKISENIKIEEI